MKKILLLLPLIALLTACQSKRDTCALYDSRQLSVKEAANKLGLEWENEQQAHWRIEKFCDYYRN